MITILADAASTTSWPDVALAALVIFGGVAMVWILFR